MPFDRSPIVLLGLVVAFLASVVPAVAQDTRIVLFEDAALLPNRLNYPIAISEGRGFRILCNTRADEELVIRGLGFTALPSEVATAVDPEIIAADPLANPLLCPSADDYRIRLFAHDSGSGLLHYLQFPIALGSAEYSDRLYVPGCMELVQSLGLDLSAASASDPTQLFAGRIHQIKCLRGSPVARAEPTTFEGWCTKGNLSEDQRATVLAILDATPGGIRALGVSLACGEADTFLRSVATLNLRSSGVRSLEPLSPLTHLIGLSLSGNHITDIGPLARLTALVRLDLADNAIGATAALSPLGALLELDLSENNISNIRPLSSLLALSSLDLSNNPLSDLEPLALMQNIQSVDISNTGANSISALTRLTGLRQARMSGLNLSFASLSEYCFVHRFDSPALGLDHPFMVALDSRLEAAQVDRNDCRAVESWAGNLRELMLDHSEIASVNPVRFFPQLRELNLTDNSIADAGPIAGLTRLMSLDLSGNRLQNLPPLNAADLHILSLGRNKLVDPTSLAELTSLRVLHLEENQLVEASSLAALTGLTDLDLQRNQIAAPAELLRILPRKPRVAGNPVCTGARVTEVFDTVADDIFNWAPAFGMDPFTLGPLGAADVQAACDLRRGTDIYALAPNGDLLFYKHFGFTDGSADWWSGVGLRIDTGWNVKQVFAGPEGSLYAITTEGDLLFYRHLGFHDGSTDTMPDGGTVIGTGWNFRQVFAGPAGASYAVTEEGDLYFYRNFAFRGDARHAAEGWQNDGIKIGNGWNFKHIFAGDEGAIYAVTFEGDLLYYRHDDFLGGSPQWWEQGGKKIGNGWNFQHIFAGPEGAIYAVNANGELLFYKHFGYRDGSENWWPFGGAVIATGWDFVHLTARR